MRSGSEIRNMFSEHGTNDIDAQIEYRTFGEMKKMLAEEYGIDISNEHYEYPVKYRQTVFLVVDTHAYEDENRIEFSDLENHTPDFFDTNVSLFVYDEENNETHYVCSVEECEPSESIEEEYETFRKMAERYPMASHVFLTEKMMFDASRLTMAHGM